jgi:OOP family OmpA-OmpF porin
MRLRIIGAAAILGLMAGSLAMAQTAPQQAGGTTADDIVCKMTDTCGDASAAAPTRQLGDEKKFSFQVANDKSAPAGPARSTGDEKKFSLQLANDKPAAAAPKASARKQPGYYAVSHKSETRTASASASAPVHSMTMQVRFENGSAKLTDDATAELAKYVTAMKDPKLADMKFVVGGHTDSKGSRTTNMDLSQRRAQAVVDYLVGNGIPQDRLTAKGYGPDQPLAGTSARNPVNRRVELVRVD